MDGFAANTGADKDKKPCVCTAAGHNIIKNGAEFKCAKCEGNTPDYDAKEQKCYKKQNNGVNGLFVVLAMALFFLF